MLLTFYMMSKLFWNWNCTIIEAKLSLLCYAEVKWKGMLGTFKQLCYNVVNGLKHDIQDGLKLYSSVQG